MLKLSQAGRCWEHGSYWERCRRRSGVGGSSHKKITAVSVALYFCEKNGRTAEATFDNSYRKCYNKRSDDNKKAICHQTVKFALYGVFPL